jgi:hypothetical protein
LPVTPPAALIRFVLVSKSVDLFTSDFVHYFGAYARTTEFGWGGEDSVAINYQNWSKIDFG